MMQTGIYGDIQASVDTNKYPRNTQELLQKIDIHEITQIIVKETVSLETQTNYRETCISGHKQASQETHRYHWKQTGIPGNTQVSMDTNKYPRKHTGVNGEKRHNWKYTGITGKNPV